MDGAKEGIEIVLKIFPTLIGLFVAVGMLSESGVIEFISDKMYSFLKNIIVFKNEYLDSINTLKEKGFVVSGKSQDGLLPDIIEIPNHPFFIGVQFQPEFTSRPWKPNPIFKAFIEAALKHGYLV